MSPGLAALIAACKVVNCVPGRFCESTIQTVSTGEAALSPRLKQSEARMDFIEFLPGAGGSSGVVSQSGGRSLAPRIPYSGRREGGNRREGDAAAPCPTHGRRSASRLIAAAA